MVRIIWSSLKKIMANELLHFNCSLVQREHLIDPVLLSSGNIVDDVTYDHYAAEQTAHDYSLIPEDLDKDVTAYSVDPSVGVVNGLSIDYVSTGTIKVVGKLPGYFDSRALYNYGDPSFYTTPTSAAEYRVTSYTVGSLGEHAYNNVLSMISGLDHTNWLSTATFTLNEINSRDLLSQPSFTATRNPSNFLALSGLDETGVSGMVGSLFGGVYSERANKPAAIISARHLYGARHYHGAIGETYSFMKADGSTVDATILARYNHPDTDVCVTYVDVDLVAAGLPVYKMMPDGWEDTYFPSCSNVATNLPDGATSGAIPVLRYALHNIDASFSTAGQQTSWHIAAIDRFNAGVTYTHTIGRNELDNFVAWEHTRDNGDYVQEGGDSGSPHFMPINTGGGIEMVLLSMTHTVGTNPSASSYLTDINAAMISLAESQGDFSGYSVLEVDLTGFTQYP